MWTASLIPGVPDDPILRRGSHWALSPVSTGGTTEEPLSIPDLLGWVRLDPVDDANENPILQSLITAARVVLERRLRQAILQRQFDYALDVEPWDRSITIPMSPLASIDRITGYGSTNGATVLSTDAYSVDTLSLPGRVTINDGYAWPTNLRQASGLVVRLTAGYSTSSTGLVGVHDALLVALRMLVAHLYEHRGETSVPFPAQVDELIQDYLLPEAA